MFGYLGFRQILWLLLAQVFVLALFVVFVGFQFSRIPGGALLDAPSIAYEFLMFAGFLLVLRFAWPVAIDRVELLWGTSAKVRINKWLEPALLVAAIFTVVASALIIVQSASPYLNGLAFGIAAAGACVPLALSTLLLVSAIRRQASYRKGIDAMQASIAGKPGLERVAASVANEAGTIETTVKANPQGFTFAGIGSKPWYDPAEFKWVAAFEEAVDEIRKESEAVLRTGDGITNYDYVGLEGDFWKSFKFVARHRPIDENLAACPTTASLLKTIPGYPAFRDAMFSILDGGGIIRPHRDVSNVFLTLHLPLIAPPNGTIEVGGLKRTWQQGKALIFDSSYCHQAVNPSDEKRVILLVDFLHPELTDEERAWVSEMRL